MVSVSERRKMGKMPLTYNTHIQYITRSGVCVHYKSTFYVPRACNKPALNRLLFLIVSISLLKYFKNSHSRLQKQCSTVTVCPLKLLLTKER